MYKVLFVVLCVCVSAMSYGQHIRSFKKRTEEIQLAEYRALANTLFDQEKYYSAAENYAKILAMAEPEDDDLWKLAESYRMLNRYKAAEEIYVQIGAKNRYPLLSFHQGLMLKGQEKYAEAIVKFEQFISQVGADNEQLENVQNQINWSKEALAIVEKGNRLKSRVQAVPLVTYTGMALAATYGPDQNLFFTGVSPMTYAKNIDVDGLKASYDSIYVNRIFSYSKDGPVIVNLKPVNKKTNSIGSATFSKDGLIMYFTECDLLDTQQCNIYVSRLKNGRWSAGEKIKGLNLEGASNKHPSLATVAGDQILFFSSDRSGGQGKYDIYYAAIDSLGNVRAVSNLGTAINTAENEYSPYYDSETGHLFFSSDGLKSLGGLDVFMAKVAPDLKSGKIFNLGKPINSGADDYYFNLSKSKTEGYVTSNRLQGCCDQIFDIVFEVPFNYNKLPDYLTEVSEFESDDSSFKLLGDRKFDYKNLAYDNIEETNQMAISDISITGSLKLRTLPLAGAMVYLMDESGTPIDSILTDIRGEFEFKKLPPGQQYAYQIATDDTDISANIVITDSAGTVLDSFSNNEQEQFFSYKQLDQSEQQMSLMAADDVSITGDLTLAGEPLGNTMVYLLDDSGHQIDSTYTDEQGQFNFKKLPPGQQYAYQIATDDTDISANIIITDGAGMLLDSFSNNEQQQLFSYKQLDQSEQQMNLMAVDDVSITGDLTLAGEPLGNTMVYLLDDSGHQIDSTYTDEQGQFNFKKLPPGQQYAYQIATDDTDISANIVITDGAGTVLDRFSNNEQQQLFSYKQLDQSEQQMSLMAADDVSITGDLTLAGEPLGNIMVYLLDDSGHQIDSTFTDEQGQFNFKKLPPGQQYAYQIAADDTDISANIVITDGAGTVLDSFSNNEQEQLFNYKKLGQSQGGVGQLAATDTGIGSLPIDSIFNPSSVKYNMVARDYASLEEQLGGNVPGVVLKVQIGAFKRPADNLFSEIASELPIIEKEVSNGLTKFLIGNYKLLKSAEPIREKAVNLGVSDAFIAVYYNGKRIAIIIY